MLSITAAICSAIAAVFSAIAAFFMVRIERRNMLDSTRPELMLSGWNRNTRNQGDQKYEILTFNKIKNVGKGPALHININSIKFIDGRPAALLSTKRLSILPANEEYEINGEIKLFWDNVPSIKNDQKYLPIEIQVYSWCSKNYRHETIYSLMVVSPFKSHIFVAGDEIASGVNLSTRRTVSKPVWRLKLLTWLTR